MARTFSVSDSVVIDADPSTIYAQISNPALMGRWSPENRGATVRGALNRRTWAWSSTATTSAGRCAGPRGAR